MSREKAVLSRDAEIRRLKADARKARAKSFKEIPKKHTSVDLEGIVEEYRKQ